jgi:hypothetical protein
MPRKRSTTFCLNEGSAGIWFSQCWCHAAWGTEYVNSFGCYL